MRKAIVITDSIANPRPFPVDSKVSLEETYPYLLRKQFPDCIFWQLSFGNKTIEELVDQAIGYLSDWEPDLVILHAGINDCRPEAFTNKEKLFIENCNFPFSSYLKKNLYKPELIRKRQKHRVGPDKFKKTLKKTRNIFDKSNVVMLEISAGAGYESARPGVTNCMKEYNSIAHKILGGNLLSIHSELQSVSGFQEDNLHINNSGHKEIFRILTNYIESKMV